jgi:hypothetical protein
MVAKAPTTKPIKNIPIPSGEKNRRNDCGDLKDGRLQMIKLDMWQKNYRC